MYGRSGALISDITKAVKYPRTYFTIDSVFVTYLTSGDSFNFTTKQTTPDPSKQMITKPQYSGYIDSTDIFSRDEIKKLITRLGDQTSGLNVGRSRLPSGYPSQSPVFRLNFGKNSYTTSYWSSSQRKYTDVNITLAILNE